MDGLIERSRKWRNSDMTQTTKVKMLTEYVSRLRNLRPNFEVPNFSSSGPGSKARLLFLLAKPGTRGAGVTNVCDPLTNDDQTARNMRQIMNDIGFNPNDALYWNVVPWFDGRRKVRAAEVVEGKRRLKELLELLPKLRAVVLVGKDAQKASDIFDGTAIRVFESAHPSPLVKARYPGKFDAIAPVWKAAAEFALN